MERRVGCRDNFGLGFEQFLSLILRGESVYPADSGYGASSFTLFCGGRRGPQLYEGRGKVAPRAALAHATDQRPRGGTGSATSRSEQSACKFDARGAIVPGRRETRSQSERRNC